MLHLIGFFYSTKMWTLDGLETKSNPVVSECESNWCVLWWMSGLSRVYFCPFCPVTTGFVMCPWTGGYYATHVFVTISASVLHNDWYSTASYSPFAISLCKTNIAWQAVNLVWRCFPRIVISSQTVLPGLVVLMRITSMFCHVLPGYVWSVL